jgi:hypothetical protein
MAVSGGGGGTGADGRVRVGPWREEGSSKHERKESKKVSFGRAQSRRMCFRILSYDDRDQQEGPSSTCGKGEGRTL